jgi:hypothetical protein
MTKRARRIILQSAENALEVARRAVVSYGGDTEPGDITGKFAGEWRKWRRIVAELEEAIAELRDSPGEQ